MFTPPPAYRSTLPTPAATPRPSCSTTGSSSRYSDLSFAQSTSSSLGTSPPVSIRERPFSHQTTTICEPENGEHEEDEEEDDSPVDPRQIQQQSNSSNSTCPKSYLYFSPFTSSTPPRPRPAQQRSYSSTSFYSYAYPLAYGESSNWDYTKQVRNGGGTDTPRSERTFKTMATDGSCVDQEELRESEELRRSEEIATNLAVESSTNSNRPQPAPLITSYPHLPSAEPFHPTTPLNASLFTSSSLSPLTSSPEPFLPTSPLSQSSPPASFPSSSNPPTLIRNPPSSTSTLSLSATSCSSLTVTPSTLTPTPSRLSLSHSRSPPQRIWSARTNRYIYIHDHSTFSLPRPNSTLSLVGGGGGGGGKSPSVRSLIEVPELPYVTRSPETRGIVEEELERGRSRERGGERARSRSRRR